MATYQFQYGGISTFFAEYLEFPSVKVSNISYTTNQCNVISNNIFPIFFILKKHYFRNKKNRLIRFFLKSNIICTLRCYSSVQSYKNFYRRKHEKNAFVFGGMTYVEKNPDFKFHARQADNITKDRACIFVTFRVRFVLAQKAKTVFVGIVARFPG